jgi:hypothetical protein
MKIVNIWEDKGCLHLVQIGQFQWDENAKEVIKVKKKVQNYVW